MTLKCVSDGVPTPTITWYKPDGSQIDRTKDTRSVVNVKMSVDRDFGDYKCDADNGLTPADFKIVKIKQISRYFFTTIMCLCLLLSSFQRFLFLDSVQVHHHINRKILKSASDSLLIKQLNNQLYQYELNWQ